MNISQQILADALVAMIRDSAGALAGGARYLADVPARARGGEGISASDALAWGQDLASPIDYTPTAAAQGLQEEIIDALAQSETLQGIAESGPVQAALGWAQEHPNVMAGAEMAAAPLDFLPSGGVLEAAGLLPLIAKRLDDLPVQALDAPEAQVLNSKAVMDPGTSNQALVDALAEEARLNEPSPYLGKKGSVLKAKDPLIERQRTAFPGIYKHPRELAIEAEARVAPEDPIMQELFGVTRADLAEIGQHGRRQGNIDPVLPGLAAKPKGAKASKMVMTDRNAQRLVDALVEAETFAPNLVQGMDNWYVMDPLYWKVVEEVGEEAAPEVYNRLNNLTGMASAGSDVLTEINRGTAANWLATQGRFDDFVRYAGVAEDKRGKRFPDDLRSVKGHAYHPTAQAQPMADFLEHGSNQQKSPKVPLYIQASGVPEVGFQTRFPVGDAHFSRAIGLADTRNKAFRKGKEVVPGASVSTPEAFDVGPWFRENVADPVGIEAVPAQARTWGLFSGQTGVETPIGAPKLELIAQQVRVAAQREGVPPKVMLGRILRGEAHAGNIDPALLTALGGGSALAALLPLLGDDEGSTE